MPFVPSRARAIHAGASTRATWPVTFRGFRRLARAYARTGAAEIWRDLVKPAFVADMRR
jgi:hypothetical protein